MFRSTFSFLSFSEVLLSQPLMRITGAFLSKILDFAQAAALQLKDFLDVHSAETKCLLRMSTLRFGRC